MNPNARKLPKVMKTAIIALLCLSDVTRISAFEQGHAVLQLQNEVLYEVKCQAFYAKPEEVNLDFVISNHSKMAMTVILGGLHRIKLYGPDGHLIRPYPYRRSELGLSFYAIESYPPGGRCENGLRLSALFPFPMTGEYRCILTQRIYLWKSSEVPKTSDLLDNDYYGTPIDVTAKEITFRVNRPTPPNNERTKVDPQNGIDEPGLEYNAMETKKYPLRGEGRFKQIELESLRSDAPESKLSTPVEQLVLQPPTPTKKAPKTKSEPTPSEEPISSTPWSIIVVLIVAATGLLWLVLKKRN